MDEPNVHQAAECLKELVACMSPSAFYDKWDIQKNYFRSTVDEVIDEDDTEILLEQLRSLENHVKYSRQTFSWREWKRKNWRFMTDSSLDVPDKISQLIIALKFLEQNLILEAHSDKWMDTHRQDWLQKCDGLVKLELQEPNFSNNLLSNVSEGLQHCGYNAVRRNSDMVTKQHYLKMGKPEIQQAAQCLKALESNIRTSTFDKEWKNVRQEFINTIDKVEDITDTEALFQQLISLDSHLDRKQKRDISTQWELTYWKTLTDVDVEKMYTITRLIITLKFMEEKLLVDVLTDEWRESRRDEWLKMCDNLVDPFLQHLFYYELLMNVDIVLSQYGYDSLKSYETDVSDVASYIHTVADELDKINKGTAIADATSGALVTAAGTLGIVGLILAPFTAGASTVLTITSLGIGGGGFFTALGSTIVHIMKNKQKTKEIQEKTKRIAGMTMCLSTMLEHFAKSLQELKAKLSSLGELGASKYIKDIGLATSCVAGGGRNIAAIVIIARQITAQGFRTSLAFEAAVPSVFKEVSSLASVASVVSGLLNSFAVAIGIFSIVMGVRKIKNGNEVAKQLRKLADNLSTATTENVAAYTAVKKYYEELSEDIDY